MTDQEKRDRDQVRFPRWATGGAARGFTSFHVEGLASCGVAPSLVVMVAGARPRCCRRRTGRRRAYDRVMTDDWHTAIGYDWRRVGNGIEIRPHPETTKDPRTDCRSSGAGVVVRQGR